MSETTYRISEMRGVKVNDAKKPDKRIGRVHRFIFHPRRRMVVGFTVKRPDVALMFHRSDLFVALDSFSIVDGHLLVDDDPSATGKKACKRLGIEWDECIIWEQMPLMTEDGREVGRVGDVMFDGQTGQVISVNVDRGGAKDLLLGTAELPADYIESFHMGMGDKLVTQTGDEFDRGAIIVSERAFEADTTGGLAAKAGAGYAVASHKAHEAVDAAKPAAADAAAKAQVVAADAAAKAQVVVGDVAGKAQEAVSGVTEKARPRIETATQTRDEAIERAGEALGAGATKLGQHLGSTRNMFSSFKESYRKALEDDDEA